jgi:hypothetical protein
VVKIGHSPKNDPSLIEAGRPITPGPNSICPAEFQQSLAMVFRHLPGRSMVHADTTYFLAQAVGYRADIAYRIAADNLPGTGQLAEGRQAKLGHLVEGPRFHFRS